MSGSLNKAIVIGRLGADPEVRRTNAGDPVVSFSLATSDRWRDKQTGERRERTEWHRVVIFNDKLAGVAEKYLKKGSKAYVEGKMQTRSWDGNDGLKRYVTEIVLQRFDGDLQLLDKSGSGGVPAAQSQDDYGRASGRDDGGGRDGRTQAMSETSSGEDPARDFDDEIPF